MKIGYVVATPDVTTPLMPAVRGAFRDNLMFLKGLGFDGVELATRDAEAFDRDELRRTLEETGLDVSLIGTAPISYQDEIEICHADADVRAEAIERLFGHIDLGAELGCPVNIGRFRGNFLEDERRAASEAWMWDGLRAGADRAGERGIKMLFEPHHRFNTNFVRSTREGLEFLDEMNHEAVGFLIDSFHMNIEDASFSGARSARRAIKSTTSTSPTTRAPTRVRAISPSTRLSARSRRWAMRAISRPSSPRNPTSRRRRRRRLNI